MRVFSVIGISKSGKTTTIEKIIIELRARGYSVGSVKEIHNEEFCMDIEGTNTLRHKAAGSQLVTARGFNETDILYQDKLGVDDILCHYDYDFVVLEGVRDANVPNIITAHTTDEIDERVNDKTFLISGRSAEIISDYNGIKALNALTDVKSIVDKIEENVQEYKSQGQYYIIENGNKIMLSTRQNLLLKKVFGDMTFDEIVLGK